MFLEHLLRLAGTFFQGIQWQVGSLVMIKVAQGSMSGLCKIDFHYGTICIRTADCVGTGPVKSDTRSRGCLLQSTSGLI